MCVCVWCTSICINKNLRIEIYPCKNIYKYVVFVYMDYGQTFRL